MLGWYLMLVTPEHKNEPSTESLDTALAGFLLSLSTGARLPTVRELAQAHRCSVASVHGALARLEDAGAVTLVRRGRGGTVLRARSLGALWSTATSGPLVLALPLPTTIRLQGLATALRAQFVAAGVEMFMIFARGSRRRLAALRSRQCHVAVMSGFAARELASPDVAPIVELPAQSLVLEHRVFYRPGYQAGARPLRVAVDRDSVDLQRLSELEFGIGVEVVPATFFEFGPLLTEARADALVLAVDEMNERWSLHQFAERPLSPPVRQRIGETDTAATLVGRAADLAVRSVVMAAVDPSAVQRVQREVISGARAPTY
jgi:hypothetical protein